MPGKTKTKKSSAAKPAKKSPPKSKPVGVKKPAAVFRPSAPEPAVPVKRPTKVMAPERRDALHRMLMGKRQELMQEITGNLGASLTEDQRRRLESAMDVGDQSLMDLDRELGISLMEMRNKRRQLIDEALARLEDSTYGLCDECGVEINEKRLAAVPFAKLCVACQSKQELIEKIEKGEEREQ
ncbi:MAG TPA: TraR/DksA family transcriptional regulator [Nitrospiraceae bacterium]|nr:TraR/DksA family transcriptional regulator [Nitrospiraceae bacterium]